jgi:hypothetical protein
MNATFELAPLESSPWAALRALLAGDWVSKAIQVAAKLGIADELRDGPRACADLAQAVGADAASLFRLLRALASVGVFAEVESGTFGLAPAGYYLRADVPGSFAAMARQHYDVEWEVWGHLLESVRTGTTAFQLVHGRSYFDFLGEHPDLARTVYDGWMDYVTSNLIPAALTYDFSSFRLLVDVGGGRGVLATEVLRKNPQLRAVVLDLPEVVAEGARRAANAGVSERLEFVPGSMFESVPGGGDVYILSAVIHDWDDEQSLAILSNCRKAMGPMAKLLLVEAIVPPGDAPSFTKLLDLEMLACFGGRERTEAEYRRLLARSGFELSRIVSTSVLNSVLEARPV